MRHLPARPSAQRRREAEVDARRLELKVRRSVGGTFSISSDLVGRLETWRKWSPAGGLVPSDEHERWIDVCKTVTKRRFSADGDEFNIEDDAGPLTWAGCDVEVVAITIDDSEVWSFAFAAFGPLVSRKPAVVAAWRAINRAAACTDGFAASFAPSCGYPHWLAGVTSRTPVAAGM